MWKKLPCAAFDVRNGVLHFFGQCLVTIFYYFAQQVRHFLNS